jgi:hypothetical protein
MSGFAILSEDEKREMLQDALDPERRSAFAAAQSRSNTGTLDDYLEFLSANMAFAGPSQPKPAATDSNLL